jgi:hypothetical protein
MSRKSLLALPLVGALVLLLTGSALADQAPPPGPEQPRTHTLTIYNGGRMVRHTFVWQGADRGQVSSGRPPKQVAGPFIQSPDRFEESGTTRSRSAP